MHCAFYNGFFSDADRKAAASKHEAKPSRVIYRRLEIITFVDKRIEKAVAHLSGAQLPGDDAGWRGAATLVGAPPPWPHARVTGKVVDTVMLISTKQYADDSRQALLKVRWQHAQEIDRL